jgi:hypothetical protein
VATRDARIDAYIAKSPEFAQPILKHLRDVVHAAVPDVEETMKWSIPHFDYNGMMCSMAAFKAHCAFGFWKGTLVTGNTEKAREAAGSLGRLTSIKDLPPKKELIALVKKAAQLNDDGVKAPTRGDTRTPKPDLPTPPDLAAALAKSKKAKTAFDAFPPSHRREYIEWITSAKADDTRQRRLDQAIEWMAEGKSRNWKYERK